MKTPHPVAYLFLMSLAISCLSTSCKHDASDDSSPNTTCRLQNYSLTYGQSGSSNPYRNEQAVYTYDAQGNLLKADTIQISSNASGSSNIHYVSNFKYNAEGYLTTYTSELNLRFEQAGDQVEVRQQSVNINFTYSHGKLAGYVSKSVGTNGLTAIKGLTVNITAAFAYNADSTLARKTVITTYEYDPKVVKEYPAYPNGWQQAWLYQNSQLVDYILKTDGTETHPATIQNGLITKMGNQDSYTTYDYDSQQRLTKTAVYNQNSLNSYYTQEWNDGKPASAALPVFKGFPTIKPVADFGALKKYSYFADVPGQGVKLLYELTNTNQFNEQGFVTSIASESRNLPDTQGTTYVTDKSPAPVFFTYDCH